jgi:hypothetical protein
MYCGTSSELSSQCLLRSAVSLRLDPIRAVNRLDYGQQLPQDVECVAYDRQVYPDALGDLGGVNVDMDDPGLGGKGMGGAGETVIKSRADVDDQVRGLQGEVGIALSVHASHAQV